MPSLQPDANRYYCYEAPELTAEASRNVYKPSEADKPIDILIKLEYANSEAAQDAVITANVTTTGKTPGTISAITKGFNNYYTAVYTFPNFDEKQIDSIVITCDVCNTASNVVTLDIKMAPTVLGFFNGVWNTENEAIDGLKALKPQTEAIKGKRAVKYELFYNQSGKSLNDATPLQDVAEVFAQRSQELDGVLASRWEFFWEMITGRYAEPKSTAGTIVSFLGNAAASLVVLLDGVFDQIMGKMVAIIANLNSNPPTAADAAAHTSKLLALADEEHTFVLVAHSQGNLFVNLAADSLRRNRPSALAKVVHIAPASPTLRGDYVLADIDIVINGLRLQGQNSVPPINLALPRSKADASGHTLIATYLDSARAALSKVIAMLQSALTSL